MASALMLTPSPCTPSCSYTKELQLHSINGKFQSLKFGALSINTRLINNIPRVNNNSKRRLCVVKFSSEISVDDLPNIPLPEISRPNSSLKFKLLTTVSGLNRGLAANEDDLRSADSAAKELEDAAGAVDLSDENLDKLQGRWKLIYSSGFASRTLGGSRPGPPIGRLLPITLGQVFQRIDVVSKDFDNIVELQLGAPWPIPPIELTATLSHKFELQGPSKVKITFEKTTVKAKGNLSQLPLLEIPRLPDNVRDALSSLNSSSSRNTGTGDFEVTYLDADTRVTRGDRGELRVFVIA